MHINDKQTNTVYSWKNDQNPSFGCPLCDEAGTKNSESPWFPCGVNCCVRVPFTGFKRF